MKRTPKWLARLPGWIASVLMIVFTTFWTYWGTAELYHEGWWGAWYNRLPYLAPIAVTLLPSLAAFRWPLVGGIAIVAVGVFAFFFFGFDVSLIGGAIALVGALFVADGLVKRRMARQDATEPKTVAAALWWRRNGRYVLLLGAPALVLVGVSVVMLPTVLTRVGDGDRSARLIEGNGVALVWAPEGPGWNWKQPGGGYPSWQDLAPYGVPPVGMEDKPGYGRQPDGEIVFATADEMQQHNLCRYLSADGTTLRDEPQHVWRMPITDEIVRSLGRHGENAGCTWQGEVRSPVECDVRPDKEPPLWSTDVPVIYYWTAKAYDERRGTFVAFDGTVNATYKLGGNPRHGYRCVKEP
jgi:hypothetical protein